MHGQPQLNIERRACRAGGGPFSPGCRAPVWPAHTPRAAPARSTRCACPAQATSLVRSRTGSTGTFCLPQLATMQQGCVRRAAPPQPSATLPPPPAEALIMTGKPMSRATWMACSAFSVTPAHPGMVLTCKGRGRQAAADMGTSRAWRHPRLQACSNRARLAPSWRCTGARRCARPPAS